ncbi:MAG TPA: DUF6632 domain-containing protein [Candidatus Acidoferrum sp.]|nr:DUF6632 domain-containing protein [Candidatus Acidoferrum sp.]
MIRERALKVVLVLVGLLFLAGVFPLLPLFRGVMPPNQPAFDQMLGSVLATLGFFLLLAVRNPPAHRSLIAFAAWSSLVHGAVMGLQAVRNVIPHSDLWAAALPMIIVGALLILLLPAKPPLPAF